MRNFKRTVNHYDQYDHNSNEDDFSNPQQSNQYGELRKMNQDPNLRKRVKDSIREQENELSSLSGFSGSEEDEQDDLKMISKEKRNRRNEYEYDEDIENRGIVLNRQEDLKEKFQKHEIMRKKLEEEKKLRILESQNNENFSDVQAKVDQK